MSKKLIISGFGASGSSAITDYVRDCGVICFLKSEAMLFKNGLSGCFDAVVNGKNPDTKKILDRYSTENEIYSTPYNKKVTKREYNNFGKEKFIEFLRKHTEKLQTDNFKDFVSAAREFTDGYVKKGCCRDTVILDNILKAPHLNKVVLFNNFKAIVVFRCPACQVYELKYKIDPIKCAENLNKSYADFFRSMDFIKSEFRKLYKNIKVIKFEDFIYNKYLRKECSDFMGIETPKKRGCFNPVISAKNTIKCEGLSNSNKIFNILENNYNKMVEYTMGSK